MKIYLIKRKETANQPYNFAAHSIVVEDRGGFYLKAVHAFLKKKYAKEYLNKMSEGVRRSREIVSVDI